MPALTILTRRLMSFMLAFVRYYHRPTTIIIVTIPLLTSCGSGRSGDAQEAQLDSLVLQEPDYLETGHEVPNEQLGIGKQQWGDLDSMIARRRIRVVVPYSFTYYYVDGTMRKGIGYEAMKAFEKSINETLKYKTIRLSIVFIPVNRQQIIPMLRQGYGDIGIGSFDQTAEVYQDVDLTDWRINGLRQVIVANKQASALHNIADLAGKEVVVARGSYFEVSVKRVSDSLVQTGHQPIIITMADPFLEAEDLIELVNNGTYAYTVSYQNTADLWKSLLDSVVIHDELPVKTNISISWIVRKNTPKFKGHVNAWMRKNRHGTLAGNILYNKYINEKRLRGFLDPKNRAQLFVLKRQFKKYADEYKLDWLLLAAQGYQESKWDQSVVSRAGAVGIMQMMPYVARSREINIPNIYVAEGNIHAGAKMMRHLIDTYFKDVRDSLNQQLLALAAYNAGPTRITRLRKEARARGISGDVWFDEVENVVAHNVGREPVTYVSNIYKYYASFKAISLYVDAKQGHTGAME